MTATGIDGLRDRYDVVVVGARCAGAATAMLLARRGLSVLVVDRSRFGSDTLSTHALTRPAVLQLSRWGLLDAVRAAGTPRVNAVTYAYDDGELTIELPPSPEIDGLYAPRRTVIDPILVDAAVSSGATVRHEANVRTLIAHDARVVGVELEHRDRRHRVHCDLVVGADGARSTVARRTGAAFEHTVDHSSACIYGFARGLPDDAYRTVFRNELAAGLIPTNDGLTSVWVSLPAHRFRRDTDHATLHHRLLTEADPESAAAVHDAGPLLGLRGFAGLHGFTRTATGPGWALVGDACDFKDPLSAHGITDALIAAELLARAVTDPRHDAQADALASYSEQRHALAALMRPAVDHLATFSWTAQTARAALKQINIAMHTEWATIAAWDSGRGDAAIPDTVSSVVDPISGVVTLAAVLRTDDVVEIVGFADDPDYWGGARRRPRVSSHGPTTTSATTSRNLQRIDP